VIGQGVVVTVTAIEGNRVRIGIDAPADVRVLRAELGGAAKRPQEKDARVAPSFASASSLSVSVGGSA
jgi:carbon storage regulator CsrA